MLYERQGAKPHAVVIHFLGNAKHDRPPDFAV